MPTAISLAPSQNFRGDDGQWSTFVVQIGTGDNVQTCEVLPANTAEAIWVVATEGCLNQPSSQSACSDSRGGLFNYGASSTFNRLNNSEVPFDTENALGGNYTESLTDGSLAYLGTDHITFDWPGSGGPSLDNQLIFAYAAKTPYVGQLGISPRPTNFTSPPPYASALGTLVEQNLTTAYWAYTAGAIYHDPPTFGSLTFGGYDAGRGNVHDVLTVPMGVENHRDLLVAINGIDISGGGGPAQVLDTPVYAVLDSLLPELWLPTATCTQFEDALGLVWNDVYSMYLIDNDQHSNLLSRNLEFTFSLGVSTTDSPSNGTNITLPYAAFDLISSFPLAGIQTNSSTSRYFPLKRANDATQIFLGRTFFQEAYVTADYDQSQFSISQVTFSPQSIKTASSNGTKSSHHLSAGAIAGIAVAAFVVIAFLCFLLWWFVGRPWYKRRQNAKFRQNMEVAHADLRGFYGTKPEAKEEQELDASTTAQGSERAEMPSPPPPASPRSMDSGKFSPVSEIAGSPIARRTLSGRSPVELPASHYFERRGESIEEEANVHDRAEMA